MDPPLDEDVLEVLAINHVTNNLLRGLLLVIYRKSDAIHRQNERLLWVKEAEFIPLKTNVKLISHEAYLCITRIDGENVFFINEY